MEQMTDMLDRKIRVVRESGQADFLSREEFISEANPKILLGEPGSGKTTFLKQLKEKDMGCDYQVADLFLKTGSKASESASANEILLIDGYDEVLLQNSDDQFADLLSKIKESGYSNWLIACRSAEWKDKLYAGRIESFFNASPIVGSISDLSIDDVRELIENLYKEVSFNDFYSMVKDYDLLDMIKNPQTVSLLIKTMEENVWEKGKTEIYENACKQLALEQNPDHQSISPDRIKPDRVMEVSGWICALLLLSGNRGINKDGGSDPIFPKLNDLEYADRYSSVDIRLAISTALFSHADSERIEPCHRTIAEFLAARWIAINLNNNEYPLSQSRIQALFHVGNYQSVPSALRGLHAWIAALDYRTAETFILADPVGCIRYAEVSKFSDDAVKKLIGVIEDIASKNPYFFVEYYRDHEPFGEGLFRQSLEDFTINFLKDENKEAQAKALLVNALSYENYSVEIAKILQEILCNPECIYALRRVCCKALLNLKKHNSNNPDINWNKIVSALLGSEKDADNYRLIFDIIAGEMENFSGKAIANVYFRYAMLLENSNETKIGGIDFLLSKNITDGKLIDLLDSFSAFFKEHGKGIIQATPTSEKKSSGKDPLLEEFDIEYEEISGTKELQSYFAQYLRIFFDREIQVSHGKIWNWLNKMDVESHSFGSYDNKIVDSIDGNPDLKSSLYVSLLSETELSAKRFREYFTRRWLHTFRYSISDACFCASWVVENRNNDWVEIWADFVVLGINFNNNAEDKGDLLTLIERHRKQFRELDAAWLDIQAKIRENKLWNDKHNKEVQKMDDEAKRQKIEFVNSITEHKEVIESGKNLNILFHAAQHILNRDFDSHDSGNVFSKSEAIIRLQDYVGEENVDSILVGIKNATKLQEIPTPRESIEQHVASSTVKMIQPICLARVMLAYFDKEMDSLNQSILKCALTDCDWGAVGRGDAGVTRKLLEVIEPQVFVDHEAIKTFICDTMEPYFEHKSSSVTGLWRVTHEEKFFNIVKDLAIIWLRRYDDIDESTLRILLHFASINSPKGELFDIVMQKINDKENSTFQVWVGAAFYLNFEWFHANLEGFVTNNHIWTLRSYIAEDSHYVELRQDASLEQANYIAQKFIPLFPYAKHPSGAWTGNYNAHDATDFIMKCINFLSEKDEGLPLLADLIKRDLGGYKNHAMWALDNGRKLKDEREFENLSLSCIRKILSSGPAGSIDDFQEIILDALAEAEDHIRTAETKPYISFWQPNNCPHEENYCRDRLADILSPILNRHNINISTERKRADETRCDILCEYGEWHMPIEIKGQWNPDLWTAASEQLEKNYSRGYSSKGRGIYLPLWFGLDVVGKKRVKAKNRKKPENLSDFRNMFFDEVSLGIAKQTKIFILDLSLPENKTHKSVNK